MAIVDMPTIRPAWLQKNHNIDEEGQEIGLLQVEPKQEEEAEDEEEIIIPVIRKRSILSRLNLQGMPSFKPRWLQPRKERRLHPTSWLDGLRGVAAFFVFIHHSSLGFFPFVRPGWGSPHSEQHYVQLPVIRIFFSGAAMVSIFFVISGYALSSKPLRLAREGQHQKLFESLSSSAFRRGPRLYLPCIFSTFITALVSLLGFFLADGITRHYPRSPTGSWIEQFSVWFGDMVQFVSPFAITTIFEPNLWTIPIEFKGSLLVFLCALGLSRVRRPIMRTGLLVSLLGYWMWMANWDLVLFLGGMVISDCALYRRSSAKQPHIIVRILHGFVVLMAVYFLSIPELDEDAALSTLGYATLENQYTPETWRHNHAPGRWWIVVGAITLVGTIEHAGPESIYQRTFTTRLAQYLGEISFSLYLWHGIVLFTLGARLFTFLVERMGPSTTAYFASLFMTASAVIPVLCWISDLSTVFVDRAAVNFGKWLMEV